MLFISVLFFCVTLFFLPIAPLLFNRIVQVILFYSTILVWNIFDLEILENGYTIYSGIFQINQINLCFEIILFICGIFILNGFILEILNPYRFLFYVENPLLKEYPLLILFTVLGQCFLINSIDFISLYLSIELQSFALYVLCALYRNSESATQAGLKYFLLGGISSAIILLGIAVVYNYTGHTQFEIIHIIGITSINSQIILGFILIMTGLLFKVASAPFHSWAPDVYDGCKNSVTSWISTIPKISIFIIILNVLYYFHTDLLSDILLYSSLLSLIIGTVLGLIQYRIKRLLAYSSISHVGFLLLCLCQYKEDSIEAFLFYIVQYSITNACIFLCLLAFGYSILIKKEDVNFIEDLQGQFKSNPILTFSFSVCLFSIAGIPPIVGFFAKQIALYTSINEGYYFISIIAVITSVISASYYLKIVNNIHLLYTKYVSAPRVQNNIGNAHALSIAILTMFIVLYAIKPQILLNSITLLSLYLFSN